MDLLRQLELRVNDSARNFPDSWFRLIILSMLFKQIVEWTTKLVAFDQKGSGCSSRCKNMLSLVSIIEAANSGI